ncbi:hypothetical protein C8R48DRAFT_366071 [Suillus tomentosus]|nr:hypothetical protein C8R48DRAFT_366071 [Suillus tomentosus]
MDCKGTKARPLWREATVGSVYRRQTTTRARTTDYEPGLLPPRQDPVTPDLSCQSLSAPLHMLPLQMQPSAVAPPKTNERGCEDLHQTTLVQ